MDRLELAAHSRRLQYLDEVHQLEPYLDLVALAWRESIEILRIWRQLAQQLPPRQEGTPCQ